MSLKVWFCTPKVRFRVTKSVIESPERRVRDRHVPVTMSLSASHVIPPTHTLQPPGMGKVWTDTSQTRVLLCLTTVGHLTSYSDVIKYKHTRRDVSQMSCWRHVISCWRHVISWLLIHSCLKLWKKPLKDACFLRTNEFTTYLVLNH